MWTDGDQILDCTSSLLNCDKTWDNATEAVAPSLSGSVSNKVYVSAFPLTVGEGKRK